MRIFGKDKKQTAGPYDGCSKAPDMQLSVEELEQVLGGVETMPEPTVRKDLCSLSPTGTHVFSEDTGSGCCKYCGFADHSERNVKAGIKVKPGGHSV